MNKRISWKFNKPLLGKPLGELVETKLPQGQQLNKNIIRKFPGNDLFM